MILALKWKDKDGISYKLGELSKDNNTYYFSINEQNLKEAIKHGCMGIGSFDLLKNTYIANNLFTFFKNRIPSKDNSDIEEILKEYNIDFYDEMELLKKTKARKMKDRYFIEEIEK